MPESVETYTKLEDRSEACSIEYQTVLTCLNSSTRTDCLAMDSNNVQTELNVSSKGVQTQDIPDEDHIYSLREGGNEIENIEHHDPFLYTSFEKTTMAEKDVYMECEEVVVETSSFCKFKAELEHELSKKNFLLKSSKDNVKLMEIYEHIDAPSIKLCLTINSDFSSDLFVHRKKIQRTHPIWEGLPVVFDNIKSVLKLLERISQYKVCTGNHEEKYQQLVPVGSGLSSNTSPEILAYREGDFQAKHYSGLEYLSTIRSVNCQLLTSRNFKCVECSEYGYSLKRRVVRLNNRLTSERPFNHTNFKHKDMTRNELIIKLSEQKEEIKYVHQELSKLKRIYEKEIRANGLLVSDHEHHTQTGKYQTRKHYNDGIDKTPLPKRK